MKVKVDWGMFIVASIIVAVIWLDDGNAGNAIDGQRKFAPCVECHGPKGVSNIASWPSLCGQDEAYLTDQLSKFRSGEQTHRMMTPMAESLTDEDIEDIAAYLSEQECK